MRDRPGTSRRLGLVGGTEGRQKLQQIMGGHDRARGQGRKHTPGHLFCVCVCVLWLLLFLSVVVVVVLFLL